MEKCCNEEYKSNKIDLSLKLSSSSSSCFGENGKERKLRRSSSLVDLANGAQWGHSLDRSCSLPAEKQQRKVPTLSPQVLAWAAAASSVNVNKPSSSSLQKLKPHPNSSKDSGLQGLKNSAEGVASNIQASTEQGNDSMASQKAPAKEISPRPADSKSENPAKKAKLGNYCSLKGDVMEILRQMPSVATTGDGPNGKRIEGFLYKYRAGQVCIVCVCHGSFLSPSEFVMHAGGKEVDNPMKHITVFPNSF